MSWLRKARGRARFLIWELLALFGVLAFWPMLLNGFAWDDQGTVVENPVIRSLWPLSRFLRSHDQAAEGLSFFLTGGRPGMVFSLALDYALWGLNPFGYHLTNLVLHLLCVFGVAGLGWWLTRSRGAAFLAGALFALHPGHAEGVIAIMGRPNLLATLFLLAGLGLYLYHLKLRGWKQVLAYLGALAAFLLACYSKETGLALLGILVVYEAFGTREAPFQNLLPRVLRLLPFFLAGALYWVHRARIIGGSFANTSWWGGSPYKNYLMAFEVFARYLRLLFFPLSLSPLHQVPVPGGVWDPGVVVGIVLLFGSLGIAVWALFRHFRVGFLVSWFLIGLVPMANFVPIPGSVVIMAEHRLYLASIGACILGGWGAWVLWERLKGWPRRVWAGFVILVLVLFGVRTYLWNGVWKNGETLSREMIATAPQSPLGYSNLGLELDQQGRREEAIAVLKKGIASNPGAANLYNNLGVDLRREGRNDEAIAAYQKGIALNPLDGDLYNNLGVALRAEGQTGAAIAAYRKAVELAPEDVKVLENLAGALDDFGARAEARAFWERALSLEPRPAWVQEIRKRLAEAD